MMDGQKQELKPSAAPSSAVGRFYFINLLRSAFATASVLE